MGRAFNYLAFLAYDLSYYVEMSVRMPFKDYALYS